MQNPARINERRDDVATNYSRPTQFIEYEQHQQYESDSVYDVQRSSCSLRCTTVHSLSDDQCKDHTQA